MQYTHILGIDLSKATIDIALSENQAKASMLNKQFSNHLKGYDALLTWLRKQQINIEQVLICLEHTGMYGRPLIAFLQSHRAFVWVQNPVEIKWSIGLQRGKNDQIDAQRICLYALRHQDKAKAYSNKDQSLEKLTDLLSTRERLVKAKQMLLVPLKEMEEVGLIAAAASCRSACQESITSLAREIKAIEVSLTSVIEAEKELTGNYELIRSVQGVGKMTALYLIVYTHNFERFDSAKKLASYCGVAPFGYCSGSSIKGKTKVHPMANKRLKAVLHMCALSSLKMQGEMRRYYDRKVGEGKNKMSSINAIRNKLLARIYACVRDQKMYSYKQAA